MLRIDSLPPPATRQPVGPGQRSRQTGYAMKERYACQGIVAGRRGAEEPIAARLASELNHSGGLLPTPRLFA